MPVITCPPQLVIVWRISERCNLGCGFCGYSRALQRPRASADAGQIMRFGALLRGYSDTYGQRVLVSWLGGEPLLWPPLAEISRTFHHEFGLQVGVTTNGTRLQSSAVCGQIIDDYDQVTISVDGPGVFHDQVRAAPGLYGRLQAAVRTLREMKERAGHGPILKANTVLMRDNVAQFESLCGELAAWGVEELTFNALGGGDRPEFYDQHHLLPEQMAWLRTALPEIRARVAPQGLRICGNTAYLERLERAAQGVPAPVADCAPGQRFLFIDEQGRASPCSFTSHGYGIPLAALNHPHDLQDLPGRFAARRRQLTLAACGNCMSTQVFGKFAAAP